MQTSNNIYMHKNIYTGCDETHGRSQWGLVTVLLKNYF